MNLLSVDREHLQQMMTWFTDESSLLAWAGPGFSYPFTDESFKKDLNLTGLRSFSLVNSVGEFVGFGQCYLRNGKCHLGRLVIGPEFRGQHCRSGLFSGQKYSHILITLLSELGCHHLQVSNVPGNVSLFVLSHNLPALNLYLHLGFVEAQYPEPIGLDDCLYLVK
ncbi:GNAT family N-acetyltransferase [Shewanella eurypsychrophilus]|uniref:GNAT family N-acetyltransferase n=1 Tax=Shewanella eurypsychrophilus TaxID=2593656 RepID=A0ABX6V564_9GAMM|nr:MULTISPECIES: GNAT family N-acetyltransferase [Shewanella]QFU22404.1 GNAT family N-acetyltransferase [Shewanella sp. YLB-09]QPG57691.1 GNAT family N-acetyltransferase [Shewanella eurypsychrophilus]